VTSDQYSTGQHAQFASSDQHQAVQSASGQFQAVSQTGTGEAVPIVRPMLAEGVGDNDITTPVDMTATSDVVPIVAQDMKLQQSAHEVLEEPEDDDDGGKDKRKSRKRLADLMP
jgi:hypothetical protein